MDKFLYYIVINLSRLPLGFLYFLSDIVFFFNHYIIRYRHEIVATNLRNSFPEKSEKELKAIHKKFDRHFTDYLFESLKGLTADPEEISQRIKILNLETFNKYVGHNTNTMLLSGHVFNFEWIAFLANQAKYEMFYFAYKPLKNPYLSEQIVKLRTKVKAEGIPAKLVFKKISEIPNNGKYAYYFLSDQSPKSPIGKPWIQFLHQDTVVFDGYERLIRQYNLATLYVEFVKVGRGQYTIELTEFLPDNGIQFEEGEVVRKFYDKLTQTIHNHPDNWLWSHKRWKHKRDSQI